jgi:hypothetical protein
MEEAAEPEPILSSPLSKLQNAQFKKWRTPDLRMMALRFFRDGSPVDDIARQLKVHRSAIYRWHNQWISEQTLTCKM